MSFQVVVITFNDVFLYNSYEFAAKENLWIAHVIYILHLFLTLLDTQMTVPPVVTNQIGLATECVMTADNAELN